MFINNIRLCYHYSKNRLILQMLNKIIYIIIGFALAFVFFPRTSQDSLRAGIVSGSISNISSNQVITAPEIATNITPPNLSAKAALVYDLGSGSILYSKNLDEKLPIASLTKLMTALIVAGHVGFEDIVSIRKNDQTIIGASMGLMVGEKIQVQNLLRGMLISSSNDAALALANFTATTPEAFVQMMNDRAVSLGLTATKFANPIGWDSDDNYSNTLDLVKISQEFLKDPMLSEIVQTKETVVASVDGKYVHKLLTTNKLLLENPEIRGIKTGFTSKALGNLMILSDYNNRQIITIVLGSQNREVDSQELLNWTLRAYKW
ncbi:MAG: hypothetical protein A3B10_01185 [Candidatus Doudnabacteria bacterium RIFCSPLOWO2_01_FULL_44_21]|uniref:Peptidase S11 D-alanyl-D-alanine carboxypeptidase A N-terminal domain-containing protein n=1 Tax=Candidatus Doudnabacteria bacterium RIFCSPLOWO2_01_FULL_44_21 TaxID=1817841 RepID=A0A1F5PXS7_9BACT|nr:MAG: hypothetical protein A3B95_04095 [Candidatus Doudnabacteria bacterium RIFCSPHIGHO2_02_FULL_43_13b]OGE94400.1 MAG: hypothetical protein A3B10_01185 [Candidatus Doudnabacteria bacterium RIFCSPLOWO2_01_FULL_44_21]